MIPRAIKQALLFFGGKKTEKMGRFTASSHFVSSFRQKYPSHFILLMWELGCQNSGRGCRSDLFHISFSGTVTFPKAVPTHDCARQVPEDRFLVETDCPFLAPVPRRGKRNEPAFVASVANRVAELRGVDLDTVAASSTANARRLFGLP